MHFQKGMCYGNTCNNIRRFFNLIGAVLGVLNSAIDIAYIFKAPYYLQTIFVVTCVLLSLRVMITMAVTGCYFGKYVVGYKPKMASINQEAAEEYE